MAKNHTYRAQVQAARSCHRGARSCHSNSRGFLHFSFWRTRLFFQNRFQSR